MKSKKEWRRSLKRIPCGVQTLSKMPSKFIDGVYPKYIEFGRGAYVTDRSNRSYIDYPLGLGAILLGYNYPSVNEAVKKQLDRGAIFTLPSFLETVLAEKLSKMIPCCEKVRFLKTGSEAVSAAVKIARAYTKREHIAICGYHGWHDWYTVSTPKNAGIPKCYEGLVHKFNYNDPQSLKDLLMSNDKYAAVVMEPYIYDAPKDGFLQEVQRLAHKHGALLIFDEVVTGFRTPGYSAGKMFGVKPDIATFGKAMANGLPISCVCGKKKIMDVLEGDCFVSSTFGGELLSIAAALETLRVVEEEGVIDHLTHWGDYLKDGYNEIAKDLSIDTSCYGYPQRTMIRFPTGNHKSLFWQECVNRGVLFGYAQFISFSHGANEVDYTLNVVREALKVCKIHWNDPLKFIKGKPAEEVFRLVATRKTNE